MKIRLSRNICVFCTEKQHRYRDSVLERYSCFVRGYHKDIPHAISNVAKQHWKVTFDDCGQNAGSIAHDLLNRNDLALLKIYPIGVT